MVEREIDIFAPITQEQTEMLINADGMPIIYDEDSPKLTAEELVQFKKISDVRKAERRKETISLRLSPQALDTAKSLGKGYTSVLSRILETVLRDKETIKKFL